MEKIEAKGEPWTDPEFPPEYRSLYDVDLDFDVIGTKFSKCSWKRVSNIYKNPKMFNYQIQSRDIK